MKKFFVVSNAIKDKGLEYTNRLIHDLEKQGGTCTGFMVTKEDGEGNYLTADPSVVPRETEFLIVIGGDGTFLHAAKDLRSKQLPTIGVNFGNMGYLTEIDANQYLEELKHIFDGNFHLEERMLLNGIILRNGATIFSDTAFNDIVLNRADTMGIIDFDVLVNGNFLNRYSADGMIISTPTGSTGYNLSVGGPVVYPSSDIILATPISAHTLNSRSIVFNGDAKIELVVKARSSEKKQRKIVSFDGAHEIDLLNEDVIYAEKSKETISIIRINNISFIEHLGKKMR